MLKRRRETGTPEKLLVLNGISLLGILYNVYGSLQHPGHQGTWKRGHKPLMLFSDPRNVPAFNTGQL